MRKFGLLLMCGLMVLSLNVGCGKKAEKTNNEPPKEEIMKKELTKEEIVEIEKEYYNSEVVLEIETYQIVTDRGAAVSLFIDDQDVVENKIFEFVNSSGEIQKGAVVSVSDSWDNVSALLHSVSDEIKFSSIIFKREKYNGAYILYGGTSDELNRLEQYLNGRKTINIKNGTKIVPVELVSYYYDFMSDNYSLFSLVIIADDDVKLDKNIGIEGFSIVGEVTDTLE